MKQKERPFRQIDEGVRRPIHGHLLNFLTLVPFWIMLWVHHWMGYSDAFQVTHNHWDEVSANYNLAMVTTLFAGIVASVVCAFRMYQKDLSLRWLGIKLLVGVIYYVSIWIR
jgi:hypothetical protein